MRILSVRCDFCDLELEYENIKRGEKIHKKFLTQYTINGFLGKDGTQFPYEGMFCSFDCMCASVEDKFTSTPEIESRLKALAKKAGYEVVKIEVETKREEQEKK